MSKEKILELAECIIQNSEGKIRMAFNEEDGTKECNKDATHFLKYKEKRIGRDLELYNFMAEISNEQVMLTMLLQEIVFPIKQIIFAYKKGMEYLRDWGLEIYPENLHEKWIDICKITL